MNQGNITQFIVEDTSTLCPGNSTREPIINFGFNVTDQNNNSYCPIPFCVDANSNADGICDAKIYVSWMGTDKSGTSCISSSSRWMNLKDYSFPDLYTNLIAVSNRANSTDNFLYDPATSITNTTVQTRLANPPNVPLTILTSNGTAANTTTNTTTNTTNTTTNTTATTG